MGGTPPASSFVRKAVAAGSTKSFRLIIYTDTVVKTDANKSCGPPAEPIPPLEFLIGNGRVEGTIPELGGDPEA